MGFFFSMANSLLACREMSKYCDIVFNKCASKLEQELQDVVLEVLLIVGFEFLFNTTCR